MLAVSIVGQGSGGLDMTPSLFSFFISQDAGVGKLSIGCSARSLASQAEMRFCASPHHLARGGSRRPGPRSRA